MNFKHLIQNDKTQMTSNVTHVLSEMIIAAERQFKNFDKTKADRNALPSRILDDIRAITGKNIELETVQSWVDAFVSIMNALGLMDTIACESELNYTIEQIIDAIEGNNIDWEATKERFPTLRNYTAEQLNAALIEQYRAAGKTHPELEKLAGKTKALKEKINIPFFKLNIEF